MTTPSFDQLYRANPDPWAFASSPYERARYATILASLSRPRYHCALEAACSIGELTALLAPSCERLIAFDISATAVARARQRCADLPQVQLQVADVRMLDLSARFDLLVFSEVGYYFDRPTLQRIILRLLAHLDTRGEFVASHWLGHGAEHTLHGDEVHSVLQDMMAAPCRHSARYDGFRIDTWTR